MTRLQAYVGDTTEWPVEVTADGVAVDLTGQTLSWLVSATKVSTPLLQVDVTDHEDAAAGESSLTLTAADLITIGGEGEYWLTGIQVAAGGAELTRVVVRLQVLDRAQRSA